MEQPQLKVNCKTVEARTVEEVEQLAAQFSKIDKDQKNPPEMVDEETDNCYDSNGHWINGIRPKRLVDNKTRKARELRRIARRAKKQAPNPLKREGRSSPQIVEERKMWDIIICNPFKDEEERKRALKKVSNVFKCPTDCSKIPKIDINRKQEVPRSHSKNFGQTIKQARSSNLF